MWCRRVPLLLSFVAALTLFRSRSLAILNRRTSPASLHPWIWTCQSQTGRCVRHDAAEKHHDGHHVYTYLEGCKSVCGQFGSLWPKPTGRTELSPKLASFHLEDASFKMDPSISEDADQGAGGEGAEDALTLSWTIFSKNLQSLKKEAAASSVPKTVDKRSHVMIWVKVLDAGLRLTLSTKESYKLSVQTRQQADKERDEIRIDIEAETFFGARHGLETLSQLVTYDAKEHCFRLPDSVVIYDAPVFAYRGLLIDTGRNYFSLDSLKRIVDAMSYNKLNVLHWHMNEQQSFPFVSQRVPELSAYGGYSQTELYYMDEVKSLTTYARLRGVLLLPEFDAPSHAAYGWQTWPAKKGMGNLTSCLGRRWKDAVATFAQEPPSGQLNPLNQNLYEVLENLYEDLIESFAHDADDLSLSMFHMGGDEVNFNCWFEDKDIRQWMIRNHFEVDPSVTPEGYLKLWSEFQEKALDRLIRANKGNAFRDGVMLWTSDLTRPDRIYKFLDPQTYVIQVWTTGTDPWISELLRMHYRLVLSNYDAWYLDCGYGAWLYSGSTSYRNNWCSPFKDWKVVYENSPKELLRLFDLDWSMYGSLILGGEATMWSEQVDEHSVEAKLWPRGCALAERLWSNPVVRNTMMDSQLEPDVAAYKANWWSEPERRILEQRRRMAQVRGIRADAIQPEFCRQHDGVCYNVPKEQPIMPLIFSDTPPDGNPPAGGAGAGDSRDLEYLLNMSLRRKADMDTTMWMLVYGSVGLLLIVLVTLRKRLLQMLDYILFLCTSTCHYYTPSAIRARIRTSVRR